MPSTAEHGAGASASARIGIAFYSVFCLSLLPLWLSPYVPSTDGPSHLFDSYLFLAYSHVPVFERAFITHIPPAGNLTGHGLAMLLLALGAQWTFAGKLILTLCMLGMVVAFDYALAAGHSASRYAVFLILPFLYNWPLQMGFWSFSLGVPFVLVCIGLCLRYHGRWQARPLLLLFFAIAAVYLCHPISWAACGIVVAILLVISEWKPFRRGPDRVRALQQFLLPLLLFVPFAIPNLIFAVHNELVVWDRIFSLPAFLWPLYSDMPLHLFAGDARPARAVFVLLLLASALNLWLRHRRRAFGYVDALLAVAAVLMLLGLFSPARIGEGTYIGVRLLLFGYLAWALWLGSTMKPRGAVVAAIAAVLVTIWLIAARQAEWHAAESSLATTVHLGSSVPSGSYVCELDFLPPSELVRPLEHAVDLLPAHQFVDVRDYEAERSGFWTRFRPGYSLDESYLKPVSVRSFEPALAHFERRTGHRLDYLLLTDLRIPAESGLRAALPGAWGQFQLVGQSTNGVALFRRVSMHARSRGSVLVGPEGFEPSTKGL